MLEEGWEAIKDSIPKEYQAVNEAAYYAGALFVASKMAGTQPHNRPSLLASVITDATKYDKRTQKAPDNESILDTRKDKR